MHGLLYCNSWCRYTVLQGHCNIKCYLHLCDIKQVTSGKCTVSTIYYAAISRGHRRLAWIMHTTFINSEHRLIKVSKILMSVSLSDEPWLKLHCCQVIHTKKMNATVWMLHVLPLIYINNDSLLISLLLSRRSSLWGKEQLQGQAICWFSSTYDFEF